MEERVSKLEAEAASTTARLAAMELKMDDRFQHIEDQLADLRRSKAGIELREDINRRFDQLHEVLKSRFQHVDQRFEGVKQSFVSIDQRFENVDQRFDRVDQRFDDVRERHEQTNKRLDRIEIEMREMVRETRSFTRWVVSGQIGIALAILVMASKPYYG